MERPQWVVFGHDETVQWFITYESAVSWAQIVGGYVEAIPELIEPDWQPDDSLS